MSILDSLEPAVQVQIIVLKDQVWLNFAHLPDRDLLNEFDQIFNSKPGFCFGQGNVLDDRICKAIYEESINPLQYSAGFPEVYPCQEVARAAKQIVEKHGLSCKLIQTPSSQSSLNRKGALS